MNRLIDLTKNPEYLIQSHQEQFALDVLMGLSSKPKSLSPKYFYDDQGSKYFQQICDTNEYYPTRCEAEIFQTYKQKIVDHIRGNEIDLVELGAGDGRKTKLILQEMIDRSCAVHYFPVDISGDALVGLVNDLGENMPEIKTKGVIAEYFNALKWLSFESKAQKFVLFLGGNIGNFSIPQAKVFLKTLWNSLNHEDLVLIGFDLRKDIDVMLAAYNDKSGATKRFNLNLLDRMNRELGADFDLTKFTHFGTYNVHLGAMESFLVSLERQSVYIRKLDTTFVFQPFEAIHTEYSFKFLPIEIEQLAADTGFELISQYTDQKSYFVDAIFKVRKNPVFR